MADGRITTFRIIALGCAIMLLLFGHIWAYGAAVIMLAIGGIGFYFLNLANRLEELERPEGGKGEMFARSIWWLLVIGFVGSLVSLVLVK